MKIQGAFSYRKEQEMSQSFLIILVCFIVVDLVASLICHPINPDLSEMVTNVFLIVLLTVVMVGLIGSMTDPSQGNTAEIQQSAADSSAIYTIQIIESDGSVSFEYHGDADAEIQSDRIVLHDNGRTWTVFRDQSSTIVITNPE